MQSACKKAGLPEFHHHSLRHFFVSNAIEQGVDFKTIAAWVGHKDGGMLVAKTYGHLRDTHSAEMAKRMTFNAGQSAPFQS
jgi:integrase